MLAFAGSFTHVRATVAEHGQGGWISWAIAAMPEITVALCVVKVRRGQGDVAVWSIGASAVAFTLAANLAQAEPSIWGLVAAGWPAWAALTSVRLIDLSPVRVQTVNRPVAPPAEPATVHLVQPIEDRTAWVAGQIEAGVRPSEVIRLGTERFDVSISTIKRELAKVRAA